MKKILYGVITLCICFIAIPIVNAETITIRDHSTLHYSKDQVLEHYQNSLSTSNYENENYYLSTPRLTVPYYEGVLLDTVKQDVLRQYNFYRWLSGLNEVTINEDKMPRSQKGALINAINNVMTHYPSKPVGMDEAFYKEAYNGVNALAEPGDTYSGNVSFNVEPQNMVKGFVDDSTNVEPNVGHRTSMLDPYAKAISFGYANDYGAISVYYDEVNQNKDTFYPWPAAGYVPAESFPATKTTRWSVRINENIKVTDNTKVLIEYLGKTYEPSILHYDNYSNTIYYDVPTSLNQMIMRDNKQYVTDIPIHFQVVGLQNGEDTVEIEYSTTFIQAKTTKLEDFLFMISVDEYRYQSIPPITTFELGETHQYLYYLMPVNATIGKMEVTIDQPDIISFDQENETITASKGGKAILTLKEPMTGIKRTYQITVNVPSTGVTIDRSQLYLTIGSTHNLVATLLPVDTTDTAIYTWSSSDPNVVIVDQNGTVTAKKDGTATITVRTKEGHIATTTVTVGEFQKGDMNGDSKILMNDVIMALRIYLKLEPITDTYLKIGDINNDGKILMNDVIYILRAYLKLV